MIKINAIGDSCPIPVIKAKKTLKDENVNGVIIDVDNKIATENLAKLAEQLGYEISTKMIADKNFEVSIKKNAGSITESFATKTENVNSIDNNSNTVIMICTETFGEGDAELGLALMKGYIYSLTEIDDVKIMPKTIIFCNSGAKIPVRNSDHLENLQTLEELGVEILTCGACLNFYKLEDELAVGKTTNMYNINELLLRASKVIKL